VYTYILISFSVNLYIFMFIYYTNKSRLFFFLLIYHVLIPCAGMRAKVTYKLLVDKTYQEEIHTLYLSLYFIHHFRS